MLTRLHNLHQNQRQRTQGHREKKRTDSCIMQGQDKNELQVPNITAPQLWQPC